MFERLENVEAKYQELTNKLSDPNIISDYNMVKDLSKEQSDLEQIVLKYKEYKKEEKELKEAKELLLDADLKEFAEEEVIRLTASLEKIQS